MQQQPQQTVNEADVNRIRRAASKVKRIAKYGKKKEGKTKANGEREAKKKYINHATHSTFDEQRNGEVE